MEIVLRRLPLSILLELIDERLQRRELLLANEFELIDKVVKVLEAFVQVLLGARLGNVVQMIVVDVSVDTKHSGKNLFHCRHEFLSKRSIRGENALIVDLRRNPLEEFLHVRGSIERVGLSSCLISP